MRLVGASNFTIKTPFIIEGMILGMIGSLVPIALIIFGYPALYDKLDGYNLTMKKDVHFADAIDINRVIIINPTLTITKQLASGSLNLGENFTFSVSQKVK